MCVLIISTSIFVAALYQHIKTANLLEKMVHL